MNFCNKYVDTLIDVSLIILIIYHSNIYNAMHRQFASLEQYCCISYVDVLQLHINTIG